MSPVNRRGYYRTEIRVPVTWEPIAEKDVRSTAYEPGHTFISPEDLPSPIDGLIEEAVPGSKEEQIFRCLSLLNNKLDFLIRQISLPPTERDLYRDTVVELCGSGLKFLTHDQVRVGDLLRMRLLMPGTFHYQIELIAKVIRVEQEMGSNVAAVEIVEIEEAARESIIKVVFQKQRNELKRERSKQETSGVD